MNTAMDFHIYIRSFIFHIQFIWKTTVERAEAKHKTQRHGNLGTMHPCTMVVTVFFEPQPAAIGLNWLTPIQNRSGCFEGIFTYKWKGTKSEWKSSIVSGFRTKQMANACVIQGTYALSVTVVCHDIFSVSAAYHHRYTWKKKFKDWKEQNNL